MSAHRAQRGRRSGSVVLGTTAGDLHEFRVQDALRRNPHAHPDFLTRLQAFLDQFSAEAGRARRRGVPRLRDPTPTMPQRRRVICVGVRGCGSVGVGGCRRYSGSHTHTRSDTHTWSCKPAKAALPPRCDSPTRHPTLDTAARDDSALLCQSPLACNPGRRRVLSLVNTPAHGARRVNRRDRI